MGLDRSKQGRGPLVAKSVAGTMVVVFGSAIYSAMEIRKRVKDTGIMNPTDEVLQAHRQLEASLIGTSDYFQNSDALASSHVNIPAQLKSM
ncbi:hypothetical protein FCV25MIE_17219 [Fagus crenata]